MAGERGPAGSHRSFAFILIVSILTGGLYFIYWYYKTNVEIKEYAKLDSSPVMRLLGLVLGFILLGIPSLYVYYLWLKDISETAKKEGLDGFSPIVNLILIFIPFGSFYTIYKAQATLNDIWEKAGKGGAAPAARASQAEESPVSVKEVEKVYLKCPRCKYKNLEDANYCLKCGEDLSK